MPNYFYNAIDDLGNKKTGYLQGDNEQDIYKKLQGLRLVPVNIQNVETMGSRRLFSRKGKAINQTDLALLCRELATLIGSGLPVADSFQILVKQVEKKHIKEIVLCVHEKIREGYSLANSMGAYPNAFPAIYLATIAAGEESGKLSQVLDQLADYSEKQLLIQQKVQQALTYPLLMIIVSLTIIVFLMIYVVPKIIVAFEDTGGQLPMLTQVLIAISNFIAGNGLILGAAVVGLFFIIKWALKKKTAIQLLDRCVLTIPLTKKVSLTLNSARFSRILSVLIAAGVDIIEAIGISAKLINNSQIRQAVMGAAEQVKQGNSLASSLQQTRYFHPITIHFIANGESTGKLDTMLAKIADYHDRNVSRLIDLTLTLFEPILILVMGSLVLLIVLAILLPMFQLTQFIG